MAGPLSRPSMNTVLAMMRLGLYEHYECMAAAIWSKRLCKISR
jgi:hypothetical protein